LIPFIQEDSFALSKVFRSLSGKRGSQRHVGQLVEADLFQYFVIKASMGVVIIVFFEAFYAPSPFSVLIEPLYALAARDGWLVRLSYGGQISLVLGKN
jgi:hypothetical protein